MSYPVLPAHSLVKTLFCLTTIVYEFGEKIHINSSLDRIMSDPDSQENLSPVHRKALNHIATNSVGGTVHSFYDDPETDIQCGITVNHEQKRICVVFRGSSSLRDWLYDIQTWKTRLPDNTHVHAGFSKQLLSSWVYQRLTDDLSTLLSNYRDYKLLLTGHSLGAALAILFGYLFSKQYAGQIQIISFASPRVGGKGFKKSFESKPNLQHFRFVNKRDTVTALPLIKYNHVGIGIQLLDSKIRVIDTTCNKWYYGSLLNCWKISQHQTSSYFEKLDKCMW